MAQEFNFFATLTSEKATEVSPPPPPPQKHSSHVEKTFTPISAKDNSAMPVNLPVHSKVDSPRTITPSNTQKIKQIVEALLFASGEPLSFQKMRDIIAEFNPITSPLLRHALMELAVDYEKRESSITLAEVANGFVLRTRPSMNEYLEILFRDRRAERLSPAATEVLAIIAYRQPITRPQIEAIRGVDCSGVTQTLLERQLITPMGRLEAPGRPTLFGTTKEFLLHYGLRDLNDLPALNSLEA